LAERLSVLTEQMRATQVLMQRVAEQNANLAPAILNLTEATSSHTLDEGARQNLRNMEIILGRILDDTAQGRAHSTAELRNEIKILTRTITAISEAENRG
jgi:hypothetical protein